MNRFAKTTAIALVALVCGAGAASAQDSGYWAEGSISAWGQELYDQYGNSHFVDPYAYDSQADIYGNIYSSDSGYLDPQIGMSDLYHTNPYATDTGSSSTYAPYVPYENPVDSHQSFINSIWE